MDSETQRETARKVARAVREAGTTHRGLTENAGRVLERRYLSKDRKGRVVEDPPGMFRRVSRNLSEAETGHGADEVRRQEVEQEFHDVMAQLDFLPNSPTLMNAGRELQQLSACFVLPVEDSLDGIFGAVKQTAMIHKSGGGTGFSFSRLRPEGDVVGSTGGVASGPVSFMSAFDAGTEVVKQGSTRRGANMAILNVDHPDILRFIDVKRDPTKLVNFNISVGATADFMERARQGEDYELVNPRSGEAVGTLNARDVFNRIADSAWETGDPGLVFLDRMNEHNPNPQLGRIESTNPCFAGNVRLGTNQGILTFRELHASQASIHAVTDNRVQAIRQVEDGMDKTATAVRMRTGTTLRKALPVFMTRRDWPVFRLETKHGYEITATEDHRVFTPEGLKALGELQPGEDILIQSGRGAWNQDSALPTFTPHNKLKGRTNRGEANPPTEWSRELGELLGWITGDGWISHGTPEGRNVPNATVGLMFGNQQKMALAPKFREVIREWLGLEGCATERNGTLTLYYSNSMWNFLESLGMKDSDSPEKEVPKAIWSAPRDAVLGYLSSLFSADGTVNVSAHGASCSIRLSSSSRELLQQVQLLLLNEGIVAKIYLRREAGEREMPDSNRQPKLYHHRAQYELIMDGQSRDTFLREIGFIIPEKQEGAEAWMDARERRHSRENFTDKVKSIEYHGTEDVYCTTEYTTHSIVANGVVAAQCGEQMLLPYESCNLGSVNLAHMVRVGEDRVEIDWDRLEETVRTGVRMLDNVIDMNNYPIPEIDRMSRETRRIGLGVMGWADLLVLLGIRYDSETALELARTLMEFIQLKAYEASGELAEERGTFPAWEGSVYASQGKKMRNSAPVTIAPTGTISIIAGVSSGIEPLFALSYVRNVMDGTRLVEANPHFEAVARQEGFYTPELMEMIAERGTLEGTGVPEWVREVFRTSHDISPEWHVRMQAAFQEYTDNAVSKTINMPWEATPEDVRTAYLLAHEIGCKGITVYRDGSKAEQVLSTGETRPEEPERTGPGIVTSRERPRRMRGVTERFRTGHGNAYITINFDEETGEPFELFGAQGKAGGCDSAQLEAISRMVSLALRSRISPEDIIGHLEGITCCPAWDDGVQIGSVPDAMAQMLRQHVQGTSRERRTAVTGPRRARCPDCNAPVEYREGCEACSRPDCGWNKCY